MQVRSEVHEAGEFFLEAVDGRLFQDELDRDEHEDEASLSVFRFGDSEVRLFHRASTSVAQVGLQLWRGAFLLADFITARAEFLFRGKRVLELAAGTGFASLIAAKSGARDVLATDIDDVLSLIRRNVAANDAEDVVKARPLDFFSDAWKVALNTELRSADVVMAADVVYDEKITTAFLDALRYVVNLRRENPPVFVLSVEKRLRVDDGGKLSAPNFDFFYSGFRDVFNEWLIEAVDVDRLPRAFDAYERVQELHLWTVKPKPI